MLNFASTIVAAYVSKNSVPLAELSGVIKDVHSTLCGLSGEQRAGMTSQKPAVPIKKWITPDYIVCLEDGKKLKMLKRYLRGTHNLSVDQYRQKWGLPRDYPMVVPNYAAKRSEFAKKIGSVAPKRHRAPSDASGSKRGARLLVRKTLLVRHYLLRKKVAAYVSLIYRSLVCGVSTDRLHALNTVTDAQRSLAGDMARRPQTPQLLTVSSTHGPTTAAATSSAR